MYVNKEDQTEFSRNTAFPETWKVDESGGPDSVPFW